MNAQPQNLKVINPMIKKVFCALTCLALCLSMAACVQDTPNPSGTGAPSTEGTSAPSTNPVVPLTQEEQSILEAMGSDINVVSDDKYIETVAELMNHTSDYEGKVYQLEGCLSAHDEHAQVYRTLVNGSQTMTLGLPLRYLEKDIADGSWIRVTAIVAQGEVDGKSTTVLDVVAIEAPEKVGQVELPWDGGDIHSH